MTAFDVKAYESTAKRLVETRDFSDEANQQLKIYNATMRINRLELLKSKIGLHLLEMSDDVSKAISGHATDAIIETYRRQAGILGDSVDIDVWKKAQEIVKGSFNGADFSERIWGRLEARIVGNTNILYAEISKLLESYLINGKGSIELARALRDKFNSTRYEAERLARTEIRRMQTATQVDFMNENGITQYKFIAEPTACTICRPLDDEVFELSEMQIGTNASPIHPNCRCSITPYVDRGAENGIIKNIEMPSDALNIDGFDQRIFDEASKALRDFEAKYDLHLDELVVKALGKDNESVPFQFQTDSSGGKGKMILAINSDFSFGSYEDFSEKVSGWYDKGYLASKNVADLVRHEMAHVLTYQGVQPNRWQTFDSELREEFVAGISGYADRTRDGAEAIAEAFVRDWNGEKIPAAAEYLLRDHIEKWRR